MASLTVQMSWGGGLRFEGTSTFGHTITTDAALASGGEESGYKPSELLLFAVAGCTGIDVVRILAKQRQQLKTLDIVVTGHNPDTYPRPFQTVEVKYIATGVDLDPDKLRQAIELSEQKYCLVSQTLETPVTVTTSYEIRPMD